MRKLFMFILFAIVFMPVVSCVSGNIKAYQEYRADGKKILCAEEMTVAPGEVKAKATCSFEAKKDGVVYSCKDIEIENLNTTFKFNLDCTVIVDKKENTEIGEDTVLMDFKIQEDLPTMNTIPNYLEKKDNEPEDHG